jgi:hypothetical protein
MGDADADVASLRAELARLRRLVGPSEQSYDDLRADVLAARDAVRLAEAAAGELRGELTEVYVALARARQIETALRHTFLGRVYRIVGRARRELGRAGAAVRARLS